MITVDATIASGQKLCNHQPLTGKNNGTVLEPGGCNKEGESNSRTVGSESQTQKHFMKGKTSLRFRSQLTPFLALPVSLDLKHKLISSSSPISQGVCLKHARRPQPVDGDRESPIIVLTNKNGLCFGVHWR